MTQRGERFISAAAVSLLVGLAMGVIAQYAAFSARLAVLEDLRPKVNAIYDALLQQGLIKPMKTASAFVVPSE